MKKTKKTRRFRKKGGTVNESEQIANAHYIQTVKPEMSTSGKYNSFDNNYVTAQNVELDDSVRDPNLHP